MSVQFSDPGQTPDTGPFKNSDGDSIGTVSVVSTSVASVTWLDGQQDGLYWDSDFGYTYGHNPPHPQSRLVLECLQANTDGKCIKYYWHKQREVSDGHGGYQWQEVANQNGTIGPMS